jgi:hypothetical protein
LLQKLTVSISELGIIMELRMGTLDNMDFSCCSGANAFL